jgi:opacity protein-like surface antigen
VPDKQSKESQRPLRPVQKCTSVAPVSSVWNEHIRNWPESQENLKALRTHLQFMYNFYNGLGVAFDVGVVTKDTFNGIFSNRQAHFLLGPRYGFYNHSRFTPFVEVLFGGARGSVSIDLNQVQEVFPASSIVLPNDVSARLTASRTSFAMMAGGGLDIRLTEKVISWRLFDADYYLVRPNSLITGQDVNKHNVRLTTGINFNWGKR